MPTSTKTKPKTTGDPVADARAAFEQAVLSSGVAVDEYRAWCAAHLVAQVEQVDRSSAAAKLGAERRLTYARLMGEAKVLPELERRAGTDANTGANFGGSSTYTTEMHRQRVAAWLEDASDYAGRPIDRVSQLVLPLPQEPRVAPLQHTAPGAYHVEVQRVLDGASRQG